MTYLDLQKLVQRQSGNKNADALLGIKDYLNLGQKDMAGSLDNWRELQTTGTLSLVDGTEAYALASNFSKFRSDAILITSPTNDEKVIWRVGSVGFRNRNPVTSNDSEGTPNEWFEDPNDDTKVRFSPIPGSSFTASYDYLALPTDMSADSDTPFLPARWHHILVDYALAMHFENPYQRNYEVSNRYWTRYANGKDQCIADYNQRFIGQVQFDYSTGVNE